MNITNEQITMFKEAYYSNKEDLEKLEDYLEQYTCLEDITDPSESYEQGYNNALEMVFHTLGIKY